MSTRIDHAMAALEQAYHDVHHLVASLHRRLDILEPKEHATAGDVRSVLADAELAKQRILQQIARLEDSLLD